MPWYCLLNTYRLYACFSQNKHCCHCIVNDRDTEHQFFGTGSGNFHQISNRESRSPSLMLQDLRTIYLNWLLCGTFYTTDVIVLLSNNTAAGSVFKSSFRIFVAFRVWTLVFMSPHCIEQSSSTSCWNVKLDSHHRHILCYRWNVGKWVGWHHPTAASWMMSPGHQFSSDTWH